MIDLSIDTSNKDPQKIQLEMSQFQDLLLMVRRPAEWWKKEERLVIKKVWQDFLSNYPLIIESADQLHKEFVLTGKWGFSILFAQRPNPLISLFHLNMAKKALWEKMPKVVALLEVIPSSLAKQHFLHLAQVVLTGKSSNPRLPESYCSAIEIDHFKSCDLEEMHHLAIEVGPYINTPFLEINDDNKEALIEKFMSSYFREILNNYPKAEKIHKIFLSLIGVDNPKINTYTDAEGSLKGPRSIISIGYVMAKHHFKKLDHLAITPDLKTHFARLIQIVLIGRSKADKLPFPKNEYICLFNGKTIFETHEILNNPEATSKVINCYLSMSYKEMVSLIYSWYKSDTLPLMCLTDLLNELGVCHRELLVMTDEKDSLSETLDLPDCEEVLKKIQVYLSKELEEITVLDEIREITSILTKINLMLDDIDGWKTRRAQAENRG